MLSCGVEPLSFIAKLFDSTWKVGLGFAIAAGLNFALRHAEIEPFKGRDLGLFGTIVIAGVVGFCLALVDGLRWAAIAIGTAGAIFLSP